MADEKRVQELLEIERKYKKVRATAEKARLRRDARIKIILRKAAAKGIKATEEEIVAELKK